jgi:hypothetical protein
VFSEYCIVSTKKIWIQSEKRVMKLIFRPTASGINARIAAMPSGIEQYGSYPSILAPHGYAYRFIGTNNQIIFTTISGCPMIQPVIIAAVLRVMA